MNKTFKVKEEIELYQFLLNEVNDSKNNIKSLLKYRQVYINDKPITQAKYNLKKNDTIEIKYSIDRENHKLNILYEDNDIIAIDKQAGLLTISTDNEKAKTAFRLVSDSIKKKNKNNRIFVVHRLDQDTSGVLIFAKNTKIKDLLQDNWDSLMIKRGYVAVVEGTPIKKEDKITSYLKDSDKIRVYSTKDQKEGKKAITNYKLIKTNGKYSLLELTIETGRKNQIRVHMQDIGNSIAGDKKYGARTNPIKRLALHANILIFTNPITKQTITLTSQYPKDFDKLTNNNK